VYVLLNFAAGHAVVGWFLEHADPLLKVTIVPRGNGALGFAQYLPKELSLYTQSQLNDMMCMALGGRASEQTFFGGVSTGAADDLQKVTRIAQAQIVNYGMSEKLGNVSYTGNEQETQFVKPFSEETAKQIDEEVRSLVKGAYDRTLLLIAKHKQQIEALAVRLIERETVNHDILVEILGPRPFTTDAYTNWLKQSNREHQEKLEKQKNTKPAATNPSENSENNTESSGLKPAAA
jgi:AFG3 family protein